MKYYFAIIFILLLFGCRLVLFSSPSDFIYDRANLIDSSDVEAIISLQKSIYVDFGIHLFIITTHEDIVNVNKYIADKVKVKTWSNGGDKGKEMFILLNVLKQNIRIKFGKLLHLECSHRYVEQLLISYLWYKDSADGKKIRVKSMIDSLYRFFQYRYDQEDSHRIISFDSKLKLDRGKDGKFLIAAKEGPENTFAVYIATLREKIKDSELDIYTKEARRKFRESPLEDSSLEVALDLLTKVPHPKLYIKDRYAVLKFPSFAKTTPPYFFIKEGDKWRIAFALMRKHITFNKENRHWRYNPGVDSRFRFAFN